jgi:protein-tyrosine-phosphatase
MAHVLWETRRIHDGRPGATLSMGTLHLEGRRMHPLAVQALAHHGLEGTSHRSQGLRTAMLQRADAVVCMAREHLQALLAIGVAPGRMILLGALDPEPGHPEDIEDPLGGSAEDFMHCLKRIERCLNALQQTG